MEAGSYLYTVRGSQTRIRALNSALAWYNESILN